MTKASRSSRTSSIPAILLARDLPKPSDHLIARHERVAAQMEEFIAQRRRQHLENAVQLALQAQRVGGPLADSLSEFGRRYAHLLQAPGKPSLRIIDGGVS